MSIVSFVILHYRDYESTELCVRSILRMDAQERIRIVIVDNDVNVPPEKRARKMRKYRGFPNVEVLFADGDGGFSHANNLGYACARKKQTDSYILMLNNDIEFAQTDFLQRLDEEYAKYPCHVMGPDIVRRNTGEHQNPMDTRLRTKKEAEYTIRMNRRALKLYPILYPLLYYNNRRMEKRITRERLMQSEPSASVQENIVPCGACLIFTPDFVRKEEKAFWPETRFYYEEYILAFRCRKNGYHILYDPALTVFHESGFATKKRFRNEKQRLKFQMEQTAMAAEVYWKFIDG